MQTDCHVDYSDPGPQPSEVGRKIDDEAWYKFSVYFKPMNSMSRADPFEIAQALSTVLGDGWYDQMELFVMTHTATGSSLKAEGKSFTKYS